MSDYTKYTESLKMMDDLVDRYTNKQDAIELTAICAGWDDLYNYVYANFKAPNSEREKGVSGKNSVVVTDEVQEELDSMKEMFKLNREEIEEQLYKIPPVILEQCFPVWMARYMLCYCKLPVTPVNLTTFDKFHQLYGYMIVYC